LTKWHFDQWSDLLAHGHLTRDHKTFFRGDDQFVTNLFCEDETLMAAVAAVAQVQAPLVKEYPFPENFGDDEDFLWA
jgi:hypothetical protein